MRCEACGKEIPDGTGSCPFCAESIVGGGPEGIVLTIPVEGPVLSVTVSDKPPAEAGVTIPVAGEVESIIVSDTPPRF